MLPANQARDPNDPAKIDQEPDDPCKEVREDARTLADIVDSLSSSANIGLGPVSQALVDKYLTG